MFPDADLAKGRTEYIQGILKNSGFREQSTTTYTDLFWCGSRLTPAPRPCASDRGSLIATRAMTRHHPFTGSPIGATRTAIVSITAARIGEA